MPERDIPSSHSLSCAILICAHSILNLGLEELLVSRFSGENILPHNVVRLCSVVVLSQARSVLDSIRDLLQKYNCGEEVEKLLHNSTFVHTEFDLLSDINNNSNGFGTLTEGRNGRMLVASEQGVGRGAVLLRDNTAYGGVVATACHCQEGPLLSEHITLALSIWRNKGSNVEKYSRFISSLVSGLRLDNPIKEDSGGLVTAVKDIDGGKVESTYWDLRQVCLMALSAVVCTLYCCTEGVDSEYFENYHILRDKAKRSGVDKIDVSEPTTGEHSKVSSVNKKVMPSKDQSIYRRVESIAAVEFINAMGPEIAVPTCTNKEKNSRKSNANKQHICSQQVPDQWVSTEAAKEPESRQQNSDYGFIRRDRLTSDSWELFQILCRLPQNTHAISKVVSDNQNKHHSRSNTIHDEVQQVRVGFAVFLTASAVNHRCQPNACIRFCARTNSSAIGSSDAPGQNRVLNYIRNLSVEVVATRSIFRGEEVSISYGPLYGRHSLELRRRVLSRQYLFTCCCPECRIELKNMQEEENRQKRLYREAVYGKHSDIEANVEKITSDARILCQNLKLLKGQLERATVLYTEAQRCDRECSTTKDKLKAMKELGLLPCAKTELASPSFNSVCEAFESQVLDPFGKKLDILQEEYFSDSPVSVTACSDYFHNYKDKELHAKEIFIVRPELLPAEALNPRLVLKSPHVDEYLYIEYCGMRSNFHDIKAHILAQRGEYKLSAAHVNMAMVLMVTSGMFPVDDVAIGREAVKCAQLLASAGALSESLRAAYWAQSILQPMLSPDDPDIMETNLMIRFLSNANRS